MPFDMEEELWKLFQKEVIPMKNWTRKELKAKLDETVIGQVLQKKYSCGNIKPYEKNSR